MDFSLEDDPSNVRPEGLDFKEFETTTGRELSVKLNAARATLLGEWKRIGKVLSSECFL